jgi:energy-coupling factor transporter ATP-binding protein EcfA2
VCQCQCVCEHCLNVIIITHNHTYIHTHTHRYVRSREGEQGLKWAQQEIIEEEVAKAKAAAIASAKLN